MDGTEEETIKETVIKKDDGMLALTILVIAIVAVILFGIRYYRNSAKKAAIDPSVFKQKSLVIPPERDAFIKAKAELDRSDFASGDELKKLLMRRALQDIPIILSLQNEGNSIEKLYKKGMLTDDMHFKVKQLKDFVDEEFQQVKDEADELMEGWGEQIWPQAMQFYQMLQKQNAAGKTDEDEEGEGEEDNEDKTEADGNKKKSDSQKKREKEKAKKQAAKESKEDPLSNLNPEDAKRLEAEKMAKKLLEEEEAEKQKQANNKKKGKK